MILAANYNDSARSVFMHKAVFYAVLGLAVLWLTIQPVTSYAYPQQYPKLTKVEKKFLAIGMRQPTYPNEYFTVIDVRNQYELGKLTALRFIEWVQNNPKGVVGFTSGSTPEYFIKLLGYYKTNWHKVEVQAELKSFGIHLKNFPKTSDLKLVQLEEIYPLTEKNYKKISNYTVRHYAKFLQIKPQNLLLMNIEKTGILSEKGMNVVFMNGKVDLSLLQRKPTSQLEIWQQQALKEVKVFCTEYEKKIRAWGGLGFYVGGISFGGYLGFNKPGGAFDNKTHMVPLDYEAVVLSAKDFGGVDYARGKVAITVGIGTITYNPNAVLIIIVAGEFKANAVRDAIENKPNVKYPATALQKFPNSRFYITDGASKYLDDRQTEDLRVKSKHGWLQKHVEEVILHVALAEKKQILSLNEKDLKKHQRGRLLLESPSQPLSAMLQSTHANLVKKIELGIKFKPSKGTKILHTAPHHEDIILGYYPLFDILPTKYKNHFAYFTSGYNCVTDNYILNNINRASDWWLDKEQDLILRKSNDKVMERFKVAYKRQDHEQLNMLESLILMRNIVSIYHIKSLDELKHTVRWLKDEYFPSKQPGDLDVSQIKMLKGMMREAEAERMLALHNISTQNITHLRSKFYSSREFMRTPRYDADVVPFISLHNKLKPDMIIVEDDPDSAPLTTNYRVFQIIAQGLRSNQMVPNPELQIIGYRTTWFKYRVADANIFVPVSNQVLKEQKRVYNACFITQKNSLFPAPGTDADGSNVKENIMREQLADLKVLLGEEYFAKSSIPEIRDAAGFMYLNHFNMNDFFRRGEDLQPEIDLEEAYIASLK